MTDPRRTRTIAGRPPRFHMDVTCDRCGTEYEFEEALVSTRGTTVKCTQCGHLFKVYKPEAPVEPEAQRNPWTVRRADGSIHRLSSLADLTRLIEEGAFGREDELSRTSKAWKRLGDIEELGPYFSRTAVSTYVRPRRATGAPQLGQRKLPPRRRTETPQGNEAVARAGDTLVGRLAPGVTAPTAAVSGRGATGSPPSAASDRSSEPGALPIPNLAPSGADEPSEPTDSAETEPTTVHTPRRLQREIAPLDDLSDAYESFGRRKPPPLWVWLFAIAATIGAVLIWYSPLFDKRVTPVETTRPDPAIQFLARADQAFATHRENRFEDAIADYTKALAFHENDPRVLSSISRVYNVWAQELLVRAEIRGKQVGNSQNVDERSQVLTLQNKARELAEQGKRHAENAARKNPGNEEAEIALSDALRLTNNLVSARAGLDRARGDTSSDAETLRVAALLAIAEAGGDLRAGSKLASQAVAQDPELIRTRLLLARCLIADGDLQGARAELARVIARDRSHPGVSLVEQELSLPKVSPEAAKSEPLPSRDLADAGLPNATRGSDKERDRGKDGDGTGFDNLSHEQYIARGQKMLEDGQVTNAKRMFEQAIFIRPSSAEGYAGLGFVALEKGRPKLAVEHFQTAKREGNGEALIGLGEAYRRLNRHRDALRAYQSYVNEYPRGPQISIARTQVERLSEEASANKK